MVDTCFRKKWWLLILAVAICGFCVPFANASKKPEPDPQVPKKVTYVGKARLESAFEETQCSICVENFTDQDENLIKLPCGHVFHADCIDGWFLKANTCPLCRAELRRAYMDERLVKIITEMVKKNDESLGEKKFNLLFRAVREGYIAVLKKLLEKGMNVDVNVKWDYSANDRDWTPLHVAAQYSQGDNKEIRLEIIKLLVEKGADLLAQNSGGQLPIDLVSDEKSQAYKYLDLDDQAYLKIINEKFGNAKLMIKVWKKTLEGGNLVLLREIINKRCNINVNLNANNLKPMHVLMFYGAASPQENRYKMAKLLVENGADLLAKDARGDIPIDLAKHNNANISLDEYKKLDIYKYVELETKRQPWKQKMEEARSIVTDKGALLKNVKEAWCTIFICGDAEFLKSIIKKTFYINTGMGEERDLTPTHLLMMYRSDIIPGISTEADKLEMLKILVENGADLNAKSDLGKRPIDLLTDDKGKIEGGKISLDMYNYLAKKMGLKEKTEEDLKK